ncbi:MAG: hypothetical protein KC777_23085 [Cyanobacteria bacterium HKST-UBA02]|nr:hypothetical protein [Cyanobacteria bacterium HKST-UBA02]
MIIQSIFALLFLAILAINVLSMVVWLWLHRLVLTSAETVSAKTARIYTSYLFGSLMKGRFNNSPSVATAGIPDRDRIVQNVRSSSQYPYVANLAGIVKNLPFNLVSSILP